MSGRRSRISKDCLSLLGANIILGFPKQLAVLTFKTHVKRAPLVRDLDVRTPTHDQKLGHRTTPVGGFRTPPHTTAQSTQNVSSVCTCVHPHTPASHTVCWCGAVFKEHSLLLGLPSAGNVLFHTNPHKIESLLRNKRIILNIFNIY
jgi:hypothetical protein